MLESQNLDRGPGQFRGHNEWILGLNVTRTREFLIHTAYPRFVARLVQCRDGIIREDEMPVRFLEGVSYTIDSRTMLCEVQWIDPQPTGKRLTDLFEMAAYAMDVEREAYLQDMVPIFDAIAEANGPSAANDNGMVNDENIPF